MEYQVNMGFSPKRAAELAFADIKARTLFVGDYAYPLDAGFGPDPEAELDYLRKLEADSRGVDIDAILVKPHPRDYDKILVVDLDAVIDGSGIVMDIPTNRENYRAFRLGIEDQMLADAKLGNESDWKEADEKAFKEAYPGNNPFSDPGERAYLDAIDRDSWKDMDAQERRMLAVPHLEDIAARTAKQRAVQKFSPMRTPMSGESPSKGLKLFEALPREEQDRLIQAEYKQ